MGRRWTDDSIRRELEAFLRGFETFPPDSVFRAGGRRELWQAMAKRGEPERFAEDYGLPYRRNHRAINEAVIRERRRAALRSSDLPSWPSGRWLAGRAAPSWSPRSTAAAARSAGPTSSGFPCETCAAGAGRQRRPPRRVLEDSSATLNRADEGELPLTLASSALAGGRRIRLAPSVGSMRRGVQGITA